MATGRLGRVGGVMRRLGGGLVELALPSVCGGCGGEAVSVGGLCEGCNIALLGLVGQTYCRRCGAGLGTGVPEYPDGCVQCPSPLARYERLWRLGPYDSPLREAVRALKYRRSGRLVGRLGTLLGEAVWNTAEWEFHAVVPVPMHWRRRIFRGVDHAALLAAAVARRLDAPAARLLRRVRNTPPQVTRSRRERVANVRGAFEAADPPQIKGRRLLLVDDVTTTGATANECTRALLRAGAVSVCVAALCKADAPAAYADTLGDGPPQEAT